MLVAEFVYWGWCRDCWPGAELVTLAGGWALGW